MGSSMGLQLVGGECGEGVYTNSPRARARFINLHTKKKVKEFKLKLRNYKRPDFNRMILDLGKCGWTHEKIADVLPVSGASTVSEWARDQPCVAAKEYAVRFISCGSGWKKYPERIWL